MPFKVLIVGGAGGMGRWCAGVFNNAGFDVCISSRRSSPELEDLARAMSVCLVRPEDARDFDIVVLSVPMPVVEEMAALVGPRMKAGALLMDLSSLKKAPVEAMLGHTPASVEVIGTHPLFGPGSDGRGRAVVLVPTERSSKWLPILRDILSDAGLSVTMATAEEHDRRVGITQALTHYMYIAWGRAMERLGVDLKVNDDYGTPVYEITRELAGRVLSNDPELYTLIQTSSGAGEARRAYLEACAELSGYIESGDLEHFEKTFETVAAFYGDTEGAKKRSGRILEKVMEDRLFVLDSVGSERAFQVAKASNAVYGIVREAGRHDFVLETPEGALTLRYEDVMPMDDAGLRDLKMRTGSPIGRDIQVKMPIGANPAVLQWALGRIDGVLCVDSMTRDALGPEYVLYKFTIEVQADHSEETLQRVLTTIWGLGLEVK